MSEKMCGDRDRREELTPEKAGAGYGRRLWEELKGLLESAGAALAGCGDLRGQAYSVGVAVACRSRIQSSGSFWRAPRRNIMRLTMP